MCGRYELHSSPAAIALAFGLSQPPSLTPRYNIAPMTDVPIVRIDSTGARECVGMRWGFVPRWAKDPSTGYKMINARGETIAERPAFRTAYRYHRCLLPADGFYEWQALPGKPGRGERARKQPMHIGMKDRAPFGLAGVFERWRNPDGTVLDTCAIVTTEANALLRDVHERMPVIIAPADYDRWLDSSNEDPADLMAPYPPDAMAYYPVSSRVSAPANDDPSLIERVEQADTEGAEADAADDTPPAPEQESLF